jgi:hypothetical protein
MMPAMRTRQVMDPDRFWALIGLMEGQVDEDAVDRLGTAVTGLSDEDVVAFHERLTLVLFDLDREVLADQPVRLLEDPPDEEPIPLSDDSFLYLRAAIVAMGRDTYDAVLADPTILARRQWDWCEALLYVAPEALGRPIDTTESYETGSNREHWSERVEPEREPWDDGIRPVVVDLRDLANPIGYMFADGRPAPPVYLPPSYVDVVACGELTVALARIVAVSGGLPAELGANHVRVQVDVGGTWRLEPEVGSIFDDDELHVPRVLPVRVQVADADLRAMAADDRRDAILALAARCLLAVLPDGHPSGSELRALDDRGAPHLPR